MLLCLLFEFSDISIFISSVKNTSKQNGDYVYKMQGQLLPGQKGHQDRKFDLPLDIPTSLSQILPILPIMFPMFQRKSALLLQ